MSTTTSAPRLFRHTIIGDLPVEDWLIAAACNADECGRHAFAGEVMVDPTVPCPACDGQGREAHIGADGWPHSYPCLDCAGQGTVTAAVAAKLAAQEAAEQAEYVAALGKITKS